MSAIQVIKYKTADGRTFATEAAANDYVSRMATYDERKYGPALARLRKATGITQAEMARRLGLSPQRVNDLELDNRNPSLDTLHSIALMMDWDASELDDRFASKAELAARDKSAKKSKSTA